MHKKSATDKQNYPYEQLIPVKTKRVTTSLTIHETLTEVRSRGTIWWTCFR